jgi:ribose transport system ATP-binding protein
MTVSENINLGICGRDAYGGWILNRKRAQQRAAQAIDSLLIRVTSAGTPVGALSGGNQQKVLLSRLLETRPKILILDEPTRGVDIGAKSEIYRIVDDLAKAGVAVLVISSELTEVIGMSDRVIVMREGEIAGSLGSGNGAITEENIIALATGAGCMPQQGRSN